MPKSYAKSVKRNIFVKPSRAHKRSVKAPTDPKNLPVVERMTRERLRKMPVDMANEWKQEAVDKILNMTPRKPEQDSLLAFFAKASDDQAGPSGVSPVTAVAASPKVKYGPKKYSPITPPGLSPSKRDGIIASIKVWTPTPTK